MKRYQVYLNQASVKVIDEVSEISDFTRAQLIREVIDAAASRIGNLLAAIKPVRSNDYSRWDNIVGAVEIRGKRTVRLSTSADDTYYR